MSATEQDQDDSKEVIEPKQEVQDDNISEKILLKPNKDSPDVEEKKNIMEKADEAEEGPKAIQKTKENEESAKEIENPSPKHVPLEESQNLPKESTEVLKEPSPISHSPKISQDLDSIPQAQNQIPNAQNTSKSSESASKTHKSPKSVLHPLSPSNPSKSPQNLNKIQNSPPNSSEGAKEEDDFYQLEDPHTSPPPHPKTHPQDPHSPTHSTQNPSPKPHPKDSTTHPQNPENSQSSPLKTHPKESIPDSEAQNEKSNGPSQEEKIDKEEEIGNEGEEPNCEELIGEEEGEPVVEKPPVGEKPPVVEKTPVVEKKPDEGEGTDERKKQQDVENFSGKGSREEDEEIGSRKVDENEEVLEKDEGKENIESGENSKSALEGVGKDEEIEGQKEEPLKSIEREDSNQDPQNPPETSHPPSTPQDSVTASNADLHKDLSQVSPLKPHQSDLEIPSNPIILHKQPSEEEVPPKEILEEQVEEEQKDAPQRPSSNYHSHSYIGTRIMNGQRPSRILRSSRNSRDAKLSHLDFSIQPPDQEEGQKREESQLPTGAEKTEVDIVQTKRQQLLQDRKKRSRKSHRVIPKVQDKPDTVSQKIVQEELALLKSKNKIPSRKNNQRNISSRDQKSQHSTYNLQAMDKQGRKELGEIKENQKDFLKNREIRKENEQLQKRKATEFIRKLRKSRPKPKPKKIDEEYMHKIEAQMEERRIREEEEKEAKRQQIKARISKLKKDRLKSKQEMQKNTKKQNHILGEDKKKRLYQQMEERYVKEYQIPELERRKNELAKRRNFLMGQRNEVEEYVDKSDNNKRFHSYNRISFDSKQEKGISDQKYKRKPMSKKYTFKEKAESLVADRSREDSIGQIKGNQVNQYYHNAKALENVLKEEKSNLQKLERDKKKLIERKQKVASYSKLVREIHWDHSDRNKRDVKYNPLKKRSVIGETDSNKTFENHNRSRMAAVEKVKEIRRKQVKKETDIENRRQPEANNFIVDSNSSNDIPALNHSYLPPNSVGIKRENPKSLIVNKNLGRESVTANRESPALQVRPFVLAGKEMPSEPRDVSPNLSALNVSGLLDDSQLPFPEGVGPSLRDYPHHHAPPHNIQGPPLEVDDAMIEDIQKRLELLDEFK
ncbi:unnamed protein product [Moneuplotes crassus]|uniref:Uncharacterized protein n=2 Tax=Euplotes crassus TaxID=5936 RepID=A0AAD1UQP6_EUPCR|nr:unnamed protein product [Moneuplotes crassus]